jgi:hypothetical protein
MASVVRCFGIVTQVHGGAAQTPESKHTRARDASRFMPALEVFGRQGADIRCKAAKADVRRSRRREDPVEKHHA